MKYKLKYQTRQPVESYIAAATSYIASLTKLYDEHELIGILSSVSDEVMSLAASSIKGITANPECDIDDASKSLVVYNTNGREILTVWFERIYDREQNPTQIRKL